MAWFEQNAPVEDDALPPVLDVEATPTSRTCHSHLTQEGAIADMKVMLEEMERHYGKRPIIYTTVDFYEAILSDGAFIRLSDLGPLDQAPSGGQIRARDLAVLAIPVRRLDRRASQGHVDRDAFAGTSEQWQAFLRDEDRGRAAERRRQRPSAPQSAAP